MHGRFGRHAGCALTASLNLAPSVPALPDRSTSAKPDAVRPLPTQSLWSFSSNLTLRVHRMVSPPQASARSARRERLAVAADRLAEAVEPPRLALHVGPQALAGLDPIPAARRDRALVLDAERRHHRVASSRCTRRSRAPSGFCAAAISMSKKSERPAAVSPSLLSCDELQQRRVGLGAADAVDRGGVVAGDHQQPLDAGVARLVVGVFGLFGEIGGEALLGLGRLDLR